MSNLFKFILLFTLLVNASTKDVHSQQLKESEVPAQIKKAATENNDGQAITIWVKDPNRSKYIATIVNTNLMRNIEISMDGRLIRTSDAITENKLPAKVKATLNKSYLSKGMKGRNYLYIKDPKKGNYYSAEVRSDDGDYEITVDELGNILKEEAK